MTYLPCVLIVDESAESREVLRTLLERHGATTIEASRVDHAVGLADQFRPRLILLDAESDRSATGSTTDALRAAAGRTATPIVFLGKVRSQRDQAAGGEFVAKPYHYGQLIRKIESLLAAA